MSIIEQNDNNFIIKRTTETGIFNNDYITHMGCKWKLDFTKIENTQQYQLSLECMFNRSKLWNINANLTFTINKNNRSKGTIKENDTRFDATENIQKIEITNDLEIGQISSVECLVEIKSITGILHKTRNFDKMDKNVNNTALVVEGKKLYVNKGILSNASPVFHAMFYSGFMESTADEIPIGDVKYENMMHFLSLIYDDSEITKNSIESLLQLADRFDAQGVMKKCVKYLKKTFKVSKKDKLIFAEKYSLPELQISVLDSLNYDELRAFGEDSSAFGEQTVKELYQLSVPYMFNEKHHKCQQKEHHLVSLKRQLMETHRLH